MMLGASFIAVDDARIVSITHEKNPKSGRGTGRILMHVVSESGEALIHQRVDPISKELPDATVLEHGVKVVFVVHSAQEIAATCRGDEVGDEARFYTPAWAAGMSKDEAMAKALDIDECPGFRNVRVNEDDSIWLFLRALDRPYAIRMRLDKRDKELLATMFGEIIVNMKPEEWDENVISLDVPCTVGPQPESRDPGVAPLAAPEASGPPPAPAPTKKPGFLGRVIDLLSS